jgi:YHS domain-containing protein
MKIVLSVLLLMVNTLLFAQDNVNLKKGYAAEGYDVVAYFNNQAIEGNKKYTVTYEGVNYKFSTEANRLIFIENQKKYIPQYGGYCAYAIADKGKKVSIDPETFQILDGKLYLFYNSWGVNTLEKWNEEGANQLKEKADSNWKNFVMKGS